MGAARWQKQNLNFQKAVWGVSAVIAILVVILMVLLGYSIEVAGVFFLVIFAVLRISLAFIFKNRFANSMVRVLKFEYEEIERDFRFVFKDKNILFYRKSEDETYYYEFPGRGLRMTVEPYWPTLDMNAPPVTKVTLYEMTAKNKEFAEMLAGAIDEMAEHRAHKREPA